MKKAAAVLLCIALLMLLLTGGGICEDTASALASPATVEGLEGRDDIVYVLVFNPAIWNEYNTDADGKDLNTSLSTGSIASQIDVSMVSRAGQSEAPQFFNYPQQDFSSLPEGISLDTESVRAGGLRPIYEVGDEKEFFVGMFEIAGDRRLETLECLYAGESCYIWALDDCITEEQAERYGTEFDSLIYPEDTGTFGSARFTDGGGKVNVLYYPFANQYCAGFFMGADLFASEELGESPVVQQALAEMYMYNVDQAIINVNALVCGSEEYERSVFSTQAHEFQHLICMTDYFESYYNSFGGKLGMPDIWLNEAMSGYIEEKLYPGIQEENLRPISYMASDMVRHGQSLYNFATNTASAEDFDIGVYGSVFLFAEYLANKAGDDVFHNIHDYYRSGKNEDLSTAAALYNAVPEAFVQEIDERYAFPEGLEGATPAEIWMSKLALDFYLSMLSYDESDPAAFESLQPRALLYDELEPASIEGGGRILLATYDGTFLIPEDADPGLVYIGLDSAFQPVGWAAR